jgi:hypothetical protein
VDAKRPGWSGKNVDRAREDDFAAYVGLHWQPLVRTLVLLDCPPDRAEQVARTALSRVHRSWARIRRSDDVDVQVFRRLLRTWPATRRRHTRRTALVLHSVGGLSVVQVRAVLGGGATDLDRDLDEDLAREPADLLGPIPDDVAVGAPPLAGIIAGSARSRGVRRRALLAALAVTALVATATVVVAAHDPTAPHATAPRPASPAAREAALPYLTDGELHVGRLTVPARAVTDLVDPGVGAVYRTNEADIVLVDAQGGTAEIGHNAAPGRRQHAGLGVLADLHPAARRVRRAPRPGRAEPAGHRPDRLVPLRQAARPHRQHRLLPHPADGPGLGRPAQPGGLGELAAGPGLPGSRGRPRHRPDP